MSRLGFLLNLGFLFNLGFLSTSSFGTEQLRHWYMGLQGNRAVHGWHHADHAPLWQGTGGCVPATTITSFQSTGRSVLLCYGMEERHSFERSGCFPPTPHLPFSSHVAAVRARMQWHALVHRAIPDALSPYVASEPLWLQFVLTWPGCVQICCKHNCYPGCGALHRARPLHPQTLSLSRCSRTPLRCTAAAVAKALRVSYSGWMR